MEKFTIIFGICVLLTGFALGGPAMAGCLQHLPSLEARVRQDQDWLRRETVMAMLVEARREAARGREKACIIMLEQARAQLRSLPG